MIRALVLVFLVIGCLNYRLLQRPITTLNRLPQLQEYCGSLSRSYLSNKYLDSNYPSKSSAKYIQIYINFTNNIFLSYLDGNDTEKNIFFSNNSQNMFFFFGIFIMCAGILGLVTWPIMLFCLFSKNPHCRRPALEPYNRGQRLIPAGAAICLGLGVIISAGFGLTYSHIYTNYHDTSCAMIVIFDDLINGNVSNHGHYWAGTELIYKKLLQINDDKINNLTSQFDAIVKNPFILDLTQLLNKISTHLKNIAPGGFNLFYQTPLNESFSPNLKAKLIPSTFNNVLGVYGINSNPNDTILGRYSFLVQTLINKSLTIINEILSFNAVKDGFLNITTAFRAKILQNNTQTQQLLVALPKVKSFIEKNIRPLLPVASDSLEYFIYIFWILIATFNITVLVLMIVLRKKILKPFLLGGCTLVTMFSVANFSVAAYVSYITPYSYSLCAYANNTAINPSSFISLQLCDIDNINRNKDADLNLLNVLSNCLVNQTGNFFQNLTNNGVKVSTSNNQTLMKILKEFKMKMTLVVQYNQSMILKNMRTAQDTLINSAMFFSETSFIDFNNIKLVTNEIIPTYQTKQFNILKRLPNSVFYKSDVDRSQVCDEGNFQLDSWLPNEKMQRLAILCRIVNGSEIVNKTQCLIDNKCYDPVTKVIISNCKVCTGCINTVKTLAGFKDRDSVSGFLKSLYPNCLSFVSNLSNVWQNYYKVKQDAFNKLIVNITTLNKTLISFPSILNSAMSSPISKILNNLFADQQEVSSLDPYNGVIAGLDCSVFGEDVLIFKNALCSGTFEYLYYHRTALSQLAFFSLFMSCCLACAIKRNDPQWLRDEGKEQQALPSSTALNNREQHKRQEVNASIHQM